jgi:DNA-binding response OmpR family regulator
MVWVDDEPVALTYIEFELLATLTRHRGRVLSRQEILEIVWGRDHAADSAADSRKLVVHISRLRKKIAASRPWTIRTVQKRGYALTDVGSEPRTAIYAGKASRHPHPAN